MGSLFLVKPELRHQQQYEEMMTEWEAIGGRLNPGALSRYSARRDANVSYSEWLNWIEDDSNEATCPSGSVPQDLYFLFRRNGEGDHLLGAVTVRHTINESLYHNGSSMGFGIRPSERGNGYGKKLLQLALQKAKEEYGITKFLLTCDKENSASSNVILANGGVLEGEYSQDGGNVILRYWIDLPR